MNYNSLCPICFKPVPTGDSIKAHLCCLEDWAKGKRGVPVLKDQLAFAEIAGAVRVRVRLGEQVALFE